MSFIDELEKIVDQADDVLSDHDLRCKPEALENALIKTTSALRALIDCSKKEDTFEPTQEL